MFQIDNSLLNRFFEDPLLSSYDLAFLDEQHMATIPIYILQGLLAQLVQKRQDFPVVISTATPHLDKLVAYCEQFGTVGLVEIPSRPGEVDIRWGWMKKQEHHIEAVKRWMSELVKEGVRGKVLVRLPGEEEIKEIIEFVRQLERPDIDAIACHGKQDKDEQKRIYEPVAENALRFVAGTEIMEASITVPDAIGGIDSMQVFRRIIDWRGIARYTKVHIAKDAAKQFMGRFGRIMGTRGFYIPIIGFGGDASAQQEWDALPEHSQPEILQGDPERAILYVEALGIPFDSFPWMDKPSQKAIDTTIENLQRLGALNEEGRITEEGKKYARMPFNASLSKTIFTGKELKCQHYVKVGAAGLANNKPIFFVPSRRKDFVVTADMEALMPEEAIKCVKERTKKNFKGNEYTERYLPSDADWNGQRLARYFREQFSAGSCSDIIAMINAFIEWANNGMDSKWARARMLMPRELWMMYHNFQDIQTALQDVGLNGNGIEDSVTPELVCRALAAGMVNELAVHIEKSTYQGLLYSFRISNSSVLFPGKEDYYQIVPDYSEAPKIIIYSSVTSIFPDKNTEIRLAEYSAGIRLEDILKDNPQLCTYEYKYYKYDAEAGNVKATEYLYYVKTLLREQEVVRSDSDAVETFAEALINEKTGLLCEVKNRVYRDEIAELGRREGVERGIQSALKEWYIKQLGTACTLKDARKCKLTLTIKAMAELAGFNYAAYRKRIKNERPDVWTIDGVECSMSYPNTSRVIIEVSLETGKTVTAQKFPQWENKSIRVTVTEDDYRGVHVEAENAETLRLEIEKRRLELAWKAFKSIDDKYGDYATKVEVPYKSVFPPLPETVVWDKATNTHAYPAHVSGGIFSGVPAYYVRWFKNKDEAHEAQEEARKNKEKFEQEEYERRNFKELKEKAQQLCPEVEALCARINWNNYEPYGFTANEVSDHSGLRSELEKAKRLTGLTGYSVEPMKALKALNELKERFEQAIAAYNEHEQKKREAAEKRQRLIDAGELWPDVRVEISDRSQITTHAYCIAPDGSIVEPEHGAGNYGDVPATHIVLKHETNTYNHMCKEEWEVVLLPNNITKEQLQVIKRLEDETREYFCGKGTGWNVSRIGVVSFTTAYSRDLQGLDEIAQSEQLSNLPIDVTQYEIWKSHDPYGGVHEIDEHTMVVGMHEKRDPNYEKNREAVDAYLKNYLLEYEPLYTAPADEYDYERQVPHIARADHDRFARIREHSPMYEPVLLFIGDHAGEKPLLELRLNGRLVAELNGWSHGDIELWWSLSDDFDGIITKNDFPSIEIVGVFMLPGKEELELREEIARLNRCITELEKERSYGDRVKLTWQYELRSNRDSLFAYSQWTGTAVDKDNNKFDLKDSWIKFVCHGSPKWLEYKPFEFPQQGETWYCTVGYEARQIGRYYDRNFGAEVPVILVNPQAVDKEDEWRKRIVELEEKLKNMSSAGHDGEITPDMLTALQEKFNK